MGIDKRIRQMAKIKKAEIEEEAWKPYVTLTLSMEEALAWAQLLGKTNETTRIEYISKEQDNLLYEI
jgi:hypothetical protein